MPSLRRPFAGLERVDFTGLRMRLVDADNQVVGRLAAHLAHLLQGKDKPTFAPEADRGDVLVVVNAERAVFTGRKWEGKLYRWHTGYPGGLKEITARELWRRDPTEVLRRSVHGMLPKNSLRDARMRKLRVFPGPEHPFVGVELLPWAPPPRKLQDRGLGWLLPEGFEPMNPEAYTRRMRGSRLPAKQLQQQHLEAGGGGADVVQQQQQQQLVAVPAAAGGGVPPLVRTASVSFDDLLTADELAFVSGRRAAAAAARAAAAAGGAGGAGSSK